MKKYFVLSDLHSFFNEFLKVLDEKGFDRKNPDHIIIVCGDLFDRGPDTVNIYNYIRALPKERRILIRGNHEYLFKHLLRKPQPAYYDITNGTVKSCLDFYRIRCKKYAYLEPSDFDDYDNEWSWAYLPPDFKRFSRHLRSIWKEISSKISNLKITEWIDSDEWVDWYELGNFIFVHSFIPLRNLLGNRLSYGEGEYCYVKNWRSESTKNMKEDAT